MYLNGICFITDRSCTDASLVEMVRAALDGGIRFIQYRDKDRPRREIYTNALALRELTRRFNAIFIVNDHADIALAVDADGVHLGQDDLSLIEARRIMGSKIVGISTHSLQQAEDAEAEGADYIGFGPIFHTSTKDAGSPKGVEIIKTIKQNITIPLVAIGGINHENAADVMAAGADAIAVATALCRGDLKNNALQLLSIIHQFREEI